MGDFEISPPWRNVFATEASWKLTVGIVILFVALASASTGLAIDDFARTPREFLGGMGYLFAAAGWAVFAYQFCNFAGFANRRPNRITHTLDSIRVACDVYSEPQVLGIFDTGALGLAAFLLELHRIGHGDKLAFHLDQNVLAALIFTGACLYFVTTRPWKRAILFDQIALSYVGNGRLHDVPWESIGSIDPAVDGPRQYLKITTLAHRDRPLETGDTLRVPIYGLTADPNTILRAARAFLAGENNREELLEHASQLFEGPSWSQRRKLEKNEPWTPRR